MLRALLAPFLLFIVGIVAEDWVSYRLGVFIMLAAIVWAVIVIVQRATTR